jgi:hypothetical protein
MIPIAYAASAGTAAAQSLVAKLQAVILNPLIILLTAIALLVFLWGAFQYVYQASSGEAREEGRRHMLYGIIGMLIMLSAYAIISIAAGTFGIAV